MKNKIFIIGTVSFLIDQLIKFFSEKYLFNFDVIPNFLALIYQKNEGIAFSMLSGKKWLIIILSIILLVILFYMMKKDYIEKGNDSIIKDIMYGLLFGGIVGNLFDRIIRGYVIDYVSLNIFGYMFPIFNLADVFIIFSIILMLIFTFKEDKNEKNNVYL